MKKKRFGFVSFAFLDVSSLWDLQELLLLLRLSDCQKSAKMLKTDTVPKAEKISLIFKGGITGNG